MSVLGGILFKKEGRMMSLIEKLILLLTPKRYEVPSDGIQRLCLEKIRAKSLESFYARRYKS